VIITNQCNFFFFYRYNQTEIIGPDGTFNQEAYDNYSPVYLPVTFAFTYGASFMLITATISHVILFHGKEIWARYKASVDEEDADIHCKLMKKYPGT